MRAHVDVIITSIYSITIVFLLVRLFVYLFKKQEQQQQFNFFFLTEGVLKIIHQQSHFINFLVKFGLKSFSAATNVSISPFSPPQK